MRSQKTYKGSTQMLAIALVQIDFKKKYQKVILIKAVKTVEACWPVFEL